MTEEQQDLFDAPRKGRKLARRKDPHTSHQAAARAHEFTADHHRQVMAAMSAYGARGLTVHEIACYCRLDAHAIGKRVSELKEQGLLALLADPGTGKALSRRGPSGRSARIWVKANPPSTEKK